MKDFLFWMAAVLWKWGGRGIALDLIDDPAHKWDDHFMAAVDELFGFTTGAGAGDG